MQEIPTSVRSPHSHHDVDDGAATDQREPLGIKQTTLEFCQSASLAHPHMFGLKHDMQRRRAMKAEARPAPSPVRELAQRLCATVQAGDIRLTQKGRMRQDPASSWMNFSATQTISTTSCSFDWRARTGPFGMISVRDALVDGEGALDVNAWASFRLPTSTHRLLSRAAS